MISKAGGWLIAALVLCAGIANRTAPAEPVTYALSAKEWFIQNGFTQTGQTRLTGSRSFLWHSFEHNSIDCKIYLAELHNPEAAKSILQKYVSPGIWRERRLWFAASLQPPQPGWILHLKQLWYRVIEERRPPVPAYVFARNHDCYWEAMRSHEQINGQITADFNSNSTFNGVLTMKETKELV